MSEGQVLPAGFAFTQTALRTYRQCPRRFRLRYLEEIPWPALPPDLQAEEAMERGRRFHELARQAFLGLSVAEQVAVADEAVAHWWAVLQSSPPDLAGYPCRYPEVGLSIPLGDYRLAARYDLLAVGEGQARIVDWKTGAGLPSDAVLARDLQTRVYLYVLAVGGADYHDGRPLDPEALSLVYWHPEGPRQVVFPYSAARLAEDGALLQALLAEIAARPREEMSATADEAACVRCPYAPLCGRTGGGGWEWEIEEEPFPAGMESWSLGVE